MQNDKLPNNSMVTDKKDLKKTLSDLKAEESSLKKQIAQIKKNKVKSFNPLEYYEDSLKGIRMLIENVRFYIKKDSGI